MNLLKSASFIVKPSFYKAQLMKYVVYLNKKIIAGSIEPLFQAMVFVGVTGYAVKYVTLGSKLLIPAYIHVIRQLV